MRTAAPSASRIEERRRGMRHALRREQIVSLEGHVKIAVPDAEGNAHPHMLWALHDFHGSITQKIGLL